MDKERLRIPSDSSSGSSSRGGVSPNPNFRNGKQPSYIQANAIGPPPNSPASYSPLLPQSPQPPPPHNHNHNLPPPPGLTHPNHLGTIYPFPAVPAPGFQNLNFALGMPGVGVGHPVHHAHAPPPPHQHQHHAPVAPHHHYPTVTAPAPNQYNVNRFGVQNGMMQTPPVSPPPGYHNVTNYFGNLHAPQPMMPQQTRPVSSQYMAYNETGDNVNVNVDLEKRLSMLFDPSSEIYDNGCFTRGNLYEFMGSSLAPEQVSNGNSSYGHSSMEEEKHKPVVGGVMNPIIENIVGSINNGEYTHFGPSATSSPMEKNQNGQSQDLFREMNVNVLGARQNGVGGVEQKPLFSNIPSPPVKENVAVGRENVAVGSISPGINIKQKPQPISPVSTATTPLKDVNTDNGSGSLGKVMSASESFGKSPSPVGQPRANSPKDIAETSSRPQTPGKPSYLEVLTKAGLKSPQSTPNSSSNRKTSSTSSSPVQSSFSGNGNSDSVPNLSHRKSVDYFVGSTSSPSSSCPSASSSPATKPRNSGITGMLLKGKENVSAGVAAAAAVVKQVSPLKNSPSGSPLHVGGQHATSQGKGKVQGVTSSSGFGVGGDRKVLASQNSAVNSNRINGGGSGGKSMKNGKVPLVDKSGESEETMEDVNGTTVGSGSGGGDWGWKTYNPRGRNNNLNSVGNKNSQKKASNGHLNSDPTEKMYLDDEEEDSEGKRQNGGEEAVFERKSAGGTSSSASASHFRKSKDKDKPRSRKEVRHRLLRRVESYVYIWLAHMISALAWLWSLITDVASLSASLGMSLMQDFYEWTRTKAVPNFMDRITRCRKEVLKVFGEGWHSFKTKISSWFFRGGSSSKTEEPSPGSSKGGTRVDENILSLLGPERNITLPANGDEALKRLLSVKGQDPYSILGVRSDSSDETIRRYYKRQAVLVHPDKNLIVGAEEAFKILARAFEMVGDPIKRTEYHQKLMEAQAKEKFCGEIGKLLEQLRSKMEAASSTIRCTKCNSRHKKNITDRPLFAARYCSQCRIHHGAREGELWAERGRWFGMSWNYFACMDAHIWEINEWARCQKTNLKHIKADAHCVMYRLVAGGNNHHNQNCHGTGASADGAESEVDEWDSLINNLYKTPPGSAYGKTGTAGKPGTGCCGNGNSTSHGQSGATGQSSSQQAGRRRKGKRNK